MSGHRFVWSHDRFSAYRPECVCFTARERTRSLPLIASWRCEGDALPIQLSTSPYLGSFVRPATSTRSPTSRSCGLVPDSRPGLIRWRGGRYRMWRTQDYWISRQSVGHRGIQFSNQENTCEIQHRTCNVSNFCFRSAPGVCDASRFSLFSPGTKFAGHVTRASTSAIAK